MFTKQHYKAIAEIIRQALYNSDLSTPQYKGVVYDFADYFAGNNPRFDRKKFLDACGLKT